MLKYFFYFLLILPFGWLAVYFKTVLVLGLLIFLILLFLIFHKPLWGVFLLTFFLPFERIGSYDFSGVTVRISQVVILITILAWIIRGFAIKKFKLKANPIFWPLVIFLLINLISLFNSPNLKRSVFVFVFTLFTVSLSIFIPNLLRHKEELPKILKFLAASTLLVTIFGLYQFIGDFIGLPTGLRELYTKEILGFPRVQSTALEPLYFANFLLIPIGVFFSLFLARRKEIKPLFIISLLLLSLVNLILTVARGAYLAVIPTLFIVALFYLRHLFAGRNLLYLFIFVSVFVVSVLYFFGWANTWEKFVTHSKNIFTGSSYEERVQTFTAAYYIWLDHPFFGNGPGSFGPLTASHPLIEPSQGWKIVNNEYLELLAETGIFGLSAFLVILMILILRTLKAIIQTQDQFLKALLVGFLATFVGILLQYNTFSVLYIMHIWFTISMLLTLQNLALQKNA